MNKILLMHHDGTNTIYNTHNEKQFNMVLKAVKFLFSDGQIMGWSIDPLDM